MVGAQKTDSNTDTPYEVLRTDAVLGMYSVQLAVHSPDGVAAVPDDSAGHVLHPSCMSFLHAWELTRL